MTREDAMFVIDLERLDKYNYRNDQVYGEDEVVIEHNTNGWFVFATDAHATIIQAGKALFSNEIDAWDNFILRLRAGHRGW